MAELDPIAVDDRFFRALLDADVTALDTLLTNDFVLVGVFDGGIVSKDALLDVLRSAQLTFVSIDPAERSSRVYNEVGIVVGRTSMKCRMGDAEVGVESRYTHVFINRGGAWKMVSAQGTPIVVG